MLRGQPRHVIHRDQRRADDGLILVIGQAQEIVGKRSLVNGRQFQRHAEGFRRSALVRLFVDHTLVGEMHAEAPRRHAVARCEGRDGCRVDPAAEEAADRHIAHQLLADDGVEQMAQLVDRFRGGFLARIESIERPVTAAVHSEAAHVEVFALPHLTYAFEEGPIEQRRVEVQVFVHCLEIELSRDVIAGEQRLDLAREQDA